MDQLGVGQENASLDLSRVNFDNEVLAYLSQRKDELIQYHQQYIAAHPEIREVLNDFISSLLLVKPVSDNGRVPPPPCVGARGSSS